MSIDWDTGGAILVVSGDRTFASVLRRLRDQAPLWTVIVRTADYVYYYAYRSDELASHAAQFPERLDWSLSSALDLHEWKSSDTARRGRAPQSSAFGGGGPVAHRVVDLDANGEVVRIGEYRFAMASAPAAGAAAYGQGGGDYIDLGPMRSGAGAEASPAALRAPRDARTPVASREEAPPIDITLSAETKAEVQIGALEVVDFRIELTAEAAPLAASQGAKADPSKPIYVSLLAQNDALERVRYQEQKVDPPRHGEPRTGHFVIKGIRTGTSRLAVRFQQGGTELGVIGFVVDVVVDEARAERTATTVGSAPRDGADSEKLLLSIEEHVEGDTICYRYNLYSEELDVPLTRLLSKPLLDRGDGPAATTRAFIERIYESVTRKLASQNDLKQLNRDVRALGVTLCEELLEPEVARRLWKLRDRIQVIEIVAWEPYIPWELVRLKDPDSGEIDGRYLAEYGMVRALADEAPPRELPMKKWAYLKSDFHGQLFPPVGAELQYFTGTGASTLQARGIKAVPIPATRDDFYDAMADGGFDVLHISCHAESVHGAIDRAALVIGEETPPGSAVVQPVEIDAVTVNAEARLRGRRPLVFLNACETGRVGAVLTAWGGWPNVFMRAGAGAFVGASWAVRDKPAAAFSTAFYEALLDGRRLPEAANAARAAAGKLGDASWLAFKVYGNPRARRGPV